MGIKKINGDELIVDQIFPQTEFNGYILTPIMINDDLIDLTIAPRKNGMMATVSSRPQTTMFAIKSDVKTVGLGGDLPSDKATSDRRSSSTKDLTAGKFHIY